MGNQQSSKGPSIIGQTIPPNAPVVAGEDNSGLVKPLQVDASGKLLVSVTGAGSGGTSEVDEATFTAGFSAGTPAMGVYQATPSALSDGQEGIIALDANRNVKVNIVAGSSGNSAASATGAAVPADADYVGFNDPSGNLTGLASENLDYDTGGGTQPQTIIGIALPGSGGPVAGGTAANPIQIGDAGASLTVDGTVKWGAAGTTGGTVLTTELNSLANGGYSALGTEIDNATGLHRYGWIDISLASLNPTTGASLTLFMVPAYDGTNYPDAPGSGNPGLQFSVQTVYVATGAATKRAGTSTFYLPPFKVKFSLLNSTNVSLAASGNTATLYTSDTAF